MYLIGWTNAVFVLDDSLRDDPRDEGRCKSNGKNLVTPLSHDCRN